MRGRESWLLSKRIWLIKYGDPPALLVLRILCSCYPISSLVLFLMYCADVGKPYQEKLVDLRKELTEKKTSGMVVSMLDEVAWLFNLRGSDIDYNPVFFAYALVTHDSATLYIDEKKLTKEVKDHLKDVKTAPYGDIFGHIKFLGEAIDADKVSGKIFVSNKCSWALTLSLGENKVTEGRSPVQDAKAVKNDVEQEGMRQCHIRDGTALVKYFAWLEQELLSGRRIDEVEAADQLEKFRRYNFI
jgi:Xaa-Pro aminopeptidase